MASFLQLLWYKLPQMQFERQIVTAAGINLDDARFWLATAGALLSSLIVRFLPAGKGRNEFSALSGFALVVYPCGVSAVHSVVTACITYLLMWHAPYKCGNLTWSIIFPYTVAVHAWDSSGWSPGGLLFTGGQMVLTLKLISMAVCYQDAHTKPAKELSAYQRAHVFSKLPSPLEYFGYVYGFGGLLVFGVVEFRVYQVWANKEGPWAKTAQRQVPWTGDMRAACGALWTAMWTLAVHLALKDVWNADLLLTHWYISQPLLVKLFTVHMVTLETRCNLNYLFALGHCSAALAGLDFNGWEAGPADSGKPAQGVWGRLTPAYPLKAELADSARLLGGVYWNILTANFLRRYVYERLSAPGQKPGIGALLATELVCALWHGVYPGVIMFFVGGVILFAHSTIIYKYEHAYLPNWFANSWPWWALKVWVTKVCTDFITVAYIMLSLRESIATWASMYFLPLVYMLAVLLLGRLFPVLSCKGEKTA